MKKLILSTGSGIWADNFIREYQKETLKENEYITSERRIHKNWTEYRIYLNSDSRCK